MNAQNAITLVGRVISITPSRAKTGESKFELLIETPSKDGTLPMRFRSICYGQLAESLAVSVDDWCVASGRLESARFGQSVGIMLLLKDIFRIEANPTSPTLPEDPPDQAIDSGTF